MSEHHNDDPTLIQEIVQNHLDKVMDYQGDPERQRQVHQADLEDEQAAIQAEINDLWEEIQSGRADTGAQARLDELKQALLATDADMFDARSTQDVNPPQ